MLMGGAVVGQPTEMQQKCSYLVPLIVRQMLVLLKRSLRAVSVGAAVFSSFSAE